MVAAFLIAVTAFLIGSAPAFAAEPGAAAASTSSGPAFLTAIADMPLMPGLKEDSSAGVSFDKPQGRIVEASARGRISPAKLRAFYDATLPELGWRVQGDGRYRREGEVLRISIQTSGAVLLVRFSLSPR
ncbi:MAG: hypothetical protein V3T02_03655 [Alphaproteobacteria bacterium]